MRRIVFLVVAVVVVAGCGGGDGAAPAQNSATATATGSVLGGAGTQDMRGVVGWGGGLVAVGGDDSGEGVDGVDAAVWVSADGASWVRVDQAALAAPDFQALEAVAEWDGGLVAVGSDRGHGVVWVSPDGASWTRINDPAFGPMPDDTKDIYRNMYGVARWGGGLVVVGIEGSRDDLDAAVWMSVDGLSWVRVDDPALGGDGDQTMDSVVAWEGGLAAVGTQGHGDDLDAAVWVSADGLSWVRVEDPALGGDGGQQLGDVVAWEGGLVAVGGDDSGPDADGVVWVSADGLSWTRVEHPALGGVDNQYIAGVAVWNGGLVAVGLHNSDGAWDGAVWMSDDGVSWTRVDDPDLGGAGDQWMAEVVAWEGGLVAVGSQLGDDWDAAAWRSTDGMSWTSTYPRSEEG